MTTIKGRLGTLALPGNAGDVLRAALGLSAGAPLRIAYVPGPGDVVGTYARWLEGRHDERGNKLAYSGMFYDLVDAVGAEGLICPMAALGETSGEIDAPDAGPIRFAPVPMRWGGGRAAFVRATLAHALAVRRRLRAFAPHATVIGADTAFGYLPLLPTGRAIPSVHNTFWSVSGTPSRASRMRLRAVGTGIGAKASGAVAISQACAEQLRLVTGRADLPVRVLRPQFPGTPPPLPIEGSAEGRRLLYVGRIEESKGVFDLLAAARRVRETGVPVVLTFAGDGAARSALAGATADEDWVDVLGHLPGEGVRTRLRETDLLVCPTRSTFNEGLATVGIEAMIAGVPSVVSTAVPAAATLGDAALTYPADDVGALADRLRDGLVDGPVRRDLLASARGAGREAFFDRRHAWGTGVFDVLTGAEGPTRAAVGTDAATRPN